MIEIHKSIQLVLVRLFGVVPMLALMSMSSCSLTPNEQERDLQSKSELLGRRPFQRNKVINVYNLETSKSRVTNGSIRSSCMIFSEVWEISGGCKIYGERYKYIEPITLDPNYIDKIVHIPQKEFDRIYIINDSGKNLYDTATQ